MLLGPAFEQQGGVGSTEAKRIRQRIFDIGFAHVIRHIVEIAFGVRRLLIDGGRQSLIAQRQNADPRFESAGAAEKMTGHGLGRTDGHVFYVVAEHAVAVAEFGPFAP